MSKRFYTFLAIANGVAATANLVFLVYFGWRPLNFGAVLASAAAIVVLLPHIFLGD